MGRHAMGRRGRAFIHATLLLAGRSQVLSLVTLLNQKGRSCSADLDSTHAAAGGLSHVALPVLASMKYVCSPSSVGMPTTSTGGARAVSPVTTFHHQVSLTERRDQPSAAGRSHVTSLVTQFSK